MKKRLDTETIGNELKGASLFFPRSPVPQTDAPAPTSSPLANEPQPVPREEDRPSPQHQPIDRPIDRPAGRSVPRRTVRRAFEFYQDQLDRLLRFSLEDKMRGEKGSMSEMVRAAVDAYLARKEQGVE